MVEKDKVRKGLIFIGLSMILILSVLAIAIYEKKQEGNKISSTELVTDKVISIPDTNSTCTDSTYNESDNGLYCNVDDIIGGD